MNLISGRKLMNLLRSLFKRYSKSAILMITFTTILISIFAQSSAPIFISQHKSASLVTLDVCHQGSAFTIDTNSPAVIENFFTISLYHNYKPIQEFSNLSISLVFLPPEYQPPKA